MPQTATIIMDLIINGRRLMYQDLQTKHSMAITGAMGE
jgi:hypothetical protein